MQSESFLYCTVDKYKREPGSASEPSQWRVDVKKRATRSKETMPRGPITRARKRSHCNVEDGNEKGAISSSDFEEKSTSCLILLTRQVDARLFLYFRTPHQDFQDETCTN